MATKPDIDPSTEFDVRVRRARSTTDLILMRRWGVSGAWEDVAAFDDLDVGTEILHVLRLGMETLNRKTA